MTDRAALIEKFGIQKVRIEKVLNHYMRPAFPNQFNEILVAFHQLIKMHDEIVALPSIDCHDAKPVNKPIADKAKPQKTKEG